MQWQDVPAAAVDWSEKLSGLSDEVAKATAGVLTSTPVGYYCHPEKAGEVAVYAPEASVGDLARTLKAASRVGDGAAFLSYQDLADPDGCWVKVAYSQTLRRAGELLNFFPGQYAEGLPNAPSPLAAVLTSGLVGGGLGWAGGKVLENVLPRGYGNKLSRTGMLLGAGIGAAPGAAWAATNHLDGRDPNDPALLSGKADDSPDGVKAASTFGTPDLGPVSDADVNIDALGRTLWEAGSPPHLTAATLGAAYAAQQMPDPRATQGWVTGHQFGEFARRAAGDYATGWLVGAALNQIVGTPYRAATFGTASAAAGAIAAVVPRLFGH